MGRRLRWWCRHSCATSLLLLMASACGAQAGAGGQEFSGCCAQGLVGNLAGSAVRTVKAPLHLELSTASRTRTS